MEASPLEATEASRAASRSRITAASDRQTWPWLPIIMYHRIVERRPAHNPYNLCHSQEELERTVRWLRGSGYRIVPLRDVVQARLRGEDVRRLACLTFDDGYADFARNAWPVLQHVDAPATVFLVADRVGDWNTWDYGHDLPVAPLLNREQVRELAVQGVDFGSHSATHPLLPNVPHEDRDCEIAGSKRTLEDLLQREVALFAYPHFAQDEDTRRRVAAAGYLAAVGGEQPENTRFMLHRLDLPAVGFTLQAQLRGWRYQAQRMPMLPPAKRAVLRLSHPRR